MTVVPIEDRLAIQELTHLYCFYTDTRRPEKVVPLFAEDGEMDETLIGLPRAKGAAELSGYFHEGPQSVTSMVHFVTNHIISDFSGDAAVGLCFVLCEAVLNDGSRVKISGYYDDRYVKIGKDWRFQSRVVRPLMPTDLGNYHEQTN